MINEEFRLIKVAHTFKDSWTEILETFNIQRLAGCKLFILAPDGLDVLSLSSADE